MTSLFAWRYFKARKSANAVNIIARVSIGAIIIGAAALILVLSVFNGFEGLVKSLYSSFYTDLKVSPAAGKTMQVSPEQLRKLQSLRNDSTGGIRNYSLIAEDKALLQNSQYQSLVVLKGVDENYQYTSGVPGYLVGKDISFDIGNSDSPKLIVGEGVEGALGIRADANIYLLEAKMFRKSNSKQLDYVEDISSDTVRTSAAFKIQQDFDNKYAITNIDFVKRALKLGPDEYSAIEIALRPGSDADAMKAPLKEIFGSGYVLQNKYEQNRSLYSVMSIERWFVYAILCLMLAVAAFTLVGSLTMLVLEKRKDISVLNSLGASKGFIQRIFLKEGMLLGLIGGGVGMLLALGMALLQIKYHLIPLTGGSFLIDYFPVRLKWTDFALVGATVFIIAFIASWIPARKAAGDVVSLRSE